MKMIAQATGLTVVAGPAECTALGNILVQIGAADASCTPERLRQISIESCNTKTFKP